jgi:hypothetical protein
LVVFSACFLLGLDSFIIDSLKGAITVQITGQSTSLFPGPYTVSH